MPIWVRQAGDKTETWHFRETARLAKSYETDRYLAALLAPASSRQALISLYGLSAEMVRIRRVVGEPQLAAMRMQFWLDALPHIANGEPPAHPLALSLAATFDALGKSGVSDLSRLIEAHQTALGSGPYATLDELNSFLDLTSSNLTARAIGLVKPRSFRLDPGALAQAGGRAWGLLQLVLSNPEHSVQDWWWIPTELLNAAGIRRSELVSQRWSEAAAALATRLADLIARDLVKARNEFRRWPSETGPAVMHLAVCAPFLKKIRATTPSRGTQEISLSMLQRQFAVLWGGLKGRF